jgi:DNA-binding CsgD family transcriptional regulator
MDPMDGRSERSHHRDAARPANGRGGRSPRLSDADRAAAVRRLTGHRAAGRLTAEEVRDRSTWVDAARTRADLAQVFADLPDDHPVRTAWHDRHWRTHAVLFAVVTTALLVVWAVVRDPDPLPRDYGMDYWWPVWLALLWATVVLLHLLRTAGLLRGPTRPRPPTPAPPPLPEQATEPATEPATESATEPATEPPAGLSTEPPPADAPLPDALAVLTPRELEVLALVGQGHANKDIAAALFISERTARTHVSNILQKLELTSRTQAAILAVQAGLRPQA